MFGRKKESAIDRRLQELQREMSKVGSDIKTISRHSRAGDKPPAAAFPPARKAPGAGLVPPAARPAGGEIQEARTDSAGPDDLLTQGQDSPAGVGTTAREAGGGLPLFEPRAQIPASGREKFANYFMAGHFSNLRPMRPEKRIVRNKAIIMSVAVIIVLVWLFYFLYNH